MQSSRSVFPKQPCHCLAPNGSSLRTKDVLYLISGHCLFVLCTYYTTNFVFVNPFLNFYAKISIKRLSVRVEGKPFYHYRTNILIAFTAMPSLNSPTSPRAKKAPPASHIDTRVPRGKSRPNFLRYISHPLRESFSKKAERRT